MSDVKSKEVCDQCRVSKDWICIQSPESRNNSDKYTEERLCEPCFTSLLRNKAYISTEKRRWEAGTDKDVYINEQSDKSIPVEKSGKYPITMQ